MAHKGHIVTLIFIGGCQTTSQTSALDVSQQKPDDVRPGLIDFQAHSYLAIHANPQLRLANLSLFLSTVKVQIKNYNEPVVI